MSTSDSEQFTESVAEWVEALWSLFLDPFGAASGGQGAADYRSEVFTATSPAAGSRTLELVDDLRPGIGLPNGTGEGLPKSSVCFEPPVLTSGTTFRMVVTAAHAKGHPGATYWGHVRVGDARPASQAGGPGIFSSAETVPVWIVIP